MDMPTFVAVRKKLADAVALISAIAMAEGATSARLQAKADIIKSYLMRTGALELKPWPADEESDFDKDPEAKDKSVVNEPNKGREDGDKDRQLNGTNGGKDHCMDRDGRANDRRLGHED